MLEKLDLTRTVDKKAYKTAKADLERRMIMLQRRMLELKLPAMIVFEGWDAAGKGTLINDLINPLDPRGFTVHTTLAPNEEEAMRPFLWRFWRKTPARGRIGIFDRTWYRTVLSDRVDRVRTGKALQQAFEDIRSFERQLTEGGTVIIKFFLHISKKEQKKRFKKLLKDKSTAWRVSKNDLKRHRQYGKYMTAIEAMLTETDADIAPWTVVEAHDHNFAALKIITTIVATLEQRVAALEEAKAAKAAAAKPAQPAAVQTDKASAAAIGHAILDNTDLAQSLTREEYDKRLDACQKRLRVLEHAIFMKRIPVVMAFEGWDAAGKGGCIKRLTQKLDPRGYEVVPVAAPNDIERAHHYLWRFWIQLPKAGHITIFDRTWYGRVLVERIEGFCSEGEWKRAYREINEMEQHMAHFGTVICKFWLHIDQKEQLRRFKERERLEHKRWKITEEDWRNREKWDVYKAAVDEMAFRTSTSFAPWTIVEANNKLHARIKVLDTVIKAIEKAL
ncbi:MAG: polyphosphate:AMP phosphotransferase [Planctomycetota bacterium]